jgi:hypothetical protein
MVYRKFWVKERPICRNHGLCKFLEAKHRYMKRYKYHKVTTSAKYIKFGSRTGNNELTQQSLTYRSISKVKLSPLRNYL